VLIAAALGAAASVGFADSETARSPNRHGASRRSGVAAGGGVGARRRRDGGRGFGVDLSAAYARFAVLASRRIALSRLTMLAVIGGLPSPSTAASSTRRTRWRGRSVSISRW